MDCIENFFGSIRQQNGNNMNPTPIQFQRAFKKLFCQNYMHSNAMNWQNDLDLVLMDVKSINIPEIHDHIVSKSKAAIGLPDYNYWKDSNIPTQNAFNYVCGYI